MISCDWCGAPMHWIGWVETGMLRDFGGMVWVCTRKGCGHEVELPCACRQLTWWREQLLLTIWCRAWEIADFGEALGLADIDAPLPGRFAE